MGLSSDGVTFARTACDHSRTNQAFRIFSVFEGSSTHRLQSQAPIGPVSMCANVNDAAPVLQWPCTGGENDQWRLDAVDGDRHILRTRHSAFAALMEVSGGSVVQTSPSGAPSDLDKWRFEWRPGGYAVRAVQSNQCLTIPLTPFSGLVQAPCADTLGTGTATQVWIVD